MFEVAALADKYGKRIAPHSPKADPLSAAFLQAAAALPNLYGFQEYPAEAVGKNFQPGTSHISLLIMEQIRSHSSSLKLPDCEGQLRAVESRPSSRVNKFYSLRPSLAVYYNVSVKAYPLQNNIFLILVHCLFH